MRRPHRSTSTPNLAASPPRRPAKVEFVEGGPWLGPSEHDWLERLTRGVDTPPFGQVAEPLNETHLRV